MIERVEACSDNFRIPANGGADVAQPTSFHQLGPHHRSATPSGSKRSVYGVRRRRIHSWGAPGAGSPC